MQELLTQISEAWSALSLRQRTTLIVSALLTFAAVAAIGWWAKQPTLTTLVTGLDPKDAQSVVTQLQSEGVAFELRNGGTELAVPIERVDELRMKLAAQGLPASGHFGFKEMFAEDNIAQSNRSQMMRYQKALEDELARTIESLDEVRSARVHLVLPGERVFVDDDDHSKASVTLSLVRGTRLPQERVQAIVRIVTGAVKGLALEQVSVVDTAGHVLWEGGGDNAGTLSARQLEIKSATEADVNAKVATVLTPIIGEGRFTVRTSADLDFKKITARETNYDPNSGVLISERKSKEKSSSGSDAAGAPGTASNLPGAAQASAAGSRESQEKNDQQSSFEYSRIERAIEEPVGSVKRLSVAVLVDQIWPDSANGQSGEGNASGGEAAKPIERSPEEMAKLEALVRAAINYDVNRGDLVTIQQAPFLRDPVVELEPGFDPKAWVPLVKFPVMILLLLLVFFLFYRPLVATLRQATVRPVPATLTAEAQLGGPLQLGPPSRLEQTRQRLTMLASEEPEGVAQTVRVWLHEKE
jgi:flagellar M-ring protein FliF